MSDGQRLTDIEKIIVAAHPGRVIRFYAGLNRGSYLVPRDADTTKSSIDVYDLTLMDLGGAPTTAELLYYEADDERYYIDENLVSAPTEPPTSITVLSFREIHGIVIE